MKLDHQIEGTDFIKFAAESYMGSGGNPVILFTESAEWLYDCYTKTGDEICLKAARQIVKAYMELGFIYNDGEAVFGKILEASGTTVQQQFQGWLYPSSTIKRSSLQIREILGFWPKSSKKEYNVDRIVKDILDKLQKRECGCFYYGRRPEEITFELLILDENAYLLALEKKKVYVFEEE